MPRRLPLDSIESAAAAGLKYVSYQTSGYSRRRYGKGFRFVDTRGRAVRNPKELERIRSLAIPPAWTYRCHPHYREVRNQTKYDRLPEFAASLPSIRRRVAKDLALPGLPRDKVLATVVRLLETTMIRIGKTEYRKENESFGLTTLRNRHVDVEGSTVRFRFRGKSGVEHEVELKDKRIARIIRECHDLPGYNLFQYQDEEGAIHTIGSGDVNAYLRAITGKDFTAKDFRTWSGSVQTALTLASIEPPRSATEGKRNVAAAIKSTAKRLGNLPATCRNCHVHPAIVDTYLAGTLAGYITPRSVWGTAKETRLHPEEECVLELLESGARLKRKAA